MGMASKPVSVLYVAASEQQTLAFGAVDGKGRELGLQVCTSTYTAALGPQIHRSYEHHGRTFGDYFADETLTYYPSGETLARDPGVYFAAYCQATRAGKGFGASQSRTIFATAEERDQWLAKRIAAARRRAPKAATTGRSGRRAQA